ncbi:MAG: hypothetical protein KAW90_00515 [Dehalococcoidales bacterium]|nr:hypothetical protein [Dehalococcoidales bacterium]
MRLKGFRIGKSKEKPEKDGAETEGTTAEQIVEMEEKINGRTKNLEETAQELQEPSGESATPEEGENTPAGPHGPLDELSIEPEDKLAEVDDVEAGVPEEEGEEIKVVEVSTGSVAPPEGEKEAKVADIDGDSINNLFSDEDEEENPLANLIISLPDVTAGELIDDLNEIKGIIKEWQRS